MKKIVQAIGVALALAAGASEAYVITSDKYQLSSTSNSLIGTVEAGSFSGIYTSVSYRRVTNGLAFDSWCIEPLVGDNDNNVYTVTNLAGSGFQNAGVQASLERLWYAAENNEHAPSMSTDPAADNLTYAAAFQIAIWELVSDGTAWNFDTGLVRLQALGGASAFTTAARTLAAEWLTEASVATNPRTALEWLDAARDRDGHGQDRIRVRVPGNGGDDPVPVPATAWLLALGAAALVARKRAK
jgi:hypothetical protein